MKELLFGTAGVPLSTPSPMTTLEGIEQVARLGLTCMELEFVQGVRMGEKTALEVREVARKNMVGLTAHAPYFINLNSPEPDKIKASQQRILQTARIAALCGAESIVFHAAFYMGDPPAVVYDRVKKNLAVVIDELDREGNMVWVRPEVTGKVSQFGDLDEVLRLSTELARVAPCIDFAHWHARTGSYNSYNGFSAVLENVAEKLGKEALQNVHIHISGIAYSKKGEVRHLPLKESDFRYEEWLKALKDHGVKGFITCESPNLEEDALLLQKIYRSL